MPAISLEDLNRQIAQRERELETLRQELDSRRTQFTALTRRKEQLLGQLRQVESEIAALTAASAEQPKKAGSPPPPSGMQVKGHATLPEVILAALGEAGKAMTSRQLSEEVRRLGFSQTSRNPAKSIESRLREMKEKGLVRRASGQPGYILAPSAHGPKAEKPKTIPLVPKKEQKAVAKPAHAAKTTQPTQRGKQPPLRQVLTNVLKSNNRKYLSGGELAELVLASGYKTKSTQFVDAVWGMLGQMDNVEHLRGKGYRLKKA